MPNLNNANKWDGTNYDLLNFLLGLKQILTEKLLEITDENQNKIVAKTKELIETVEKHNLFNLTDYENVRILGWRKSLDSLPKVKVDTGTDFEVEKLQLPYTDLMYKHMMGNVTEVPLISSEYTRFTVPPNLNTLEKHKDHVNQKTKLVKIAKVYDESKVFQFLRNLVCSVTTIKIQKQIDESECILFQFSKILSQYKTKSGLEVMTIIRYNWADDIRKSYNDFVKLVDTLKYTEKWRTHNDYY